MHLTQENLNLVQKLAKIRNISDVAKKSKQGYGYTYSDITEILANVTAGMKKYSVSLIPAIVPGTIDGISETPYLFIPAVTFARISVISA